MDENHLIGKGNLLPWHYPKDLEYFKKMTES
ncbi:MAG: dihydrofolate reductase, partial [Acholeplasmataceae bacterium]|nr:dihydrofolate reductase [Acholeplasmataceae bacterium]